MNRAPLLFLNVLIVATCGLIYELLAGTIASYVLGDSVTQFSLIIGIYLFAMGVVILESLRLLNEVLRLLNEALLAVSRIILLCRLLVLLWAFLRIYGIQLRCRRVLLHRHLHLRWGVLGGHVCVLGLRLLHLYPRHWLLLLGLPLRLLLLILLAIWSHLRAMGEGLLLVHVD